MATADVVQAQYEQLEEIARRFEAQAEAGQAMQRMLQQRVEALQGGGWIGQAANTFYTEMEDILWPGLTRCQDALLEACGLTMQTVTIMRQAETEAANGFYAADQGQLSLGNALIWLGDHVSALDLVLGASQLVALLGLTFREGTSYSGQVIIEGSQALKAWVGMSPHLTHTANLPKHLAKQFANVTMIDIALTALQVGGQWVKDYRAYGADGSKLGAAVAVDTILVGSTTLVSSYIGHVGGAFLGGLVGPVGAAAGSIVGGIIVNWLADKYILQPALQSEWRSQVIDNGAEVIDRVVDKGNELIGHTSSAILRTYDDAVRAIQAMTVPVFAS